MAAVEEGCSWAGCLLSLERTWGTHSYRHVCLGQDEVQAGQYATLLTACRVAPHAPHRAIAKGRQAQVLLAAGGRSVATQGSQEPHPVQPAVLHALDLAANRTGPVASKEAAACMETPHPCSGCRAGWKRQACRSCSSRRGAPGPTSTAGRCW